jgi:hypothetical protein
MGEYADYILNGDDCQVCGMHIGDGDGYPRTCAGCCGSDNDSEREKKRKRNRAKRKRNRANRAKRRTESLYDSGTTRIENTVPTPLDGAEYIGTLPDSDKPWQFSAFKGGIICCNPDHPPMMVIDGKLEVIKL